MPLIPVRLSLLFYVKRRMEGRGKEIGMGWTDQENEKEIRRGWKKVKTGKG